MTKNQEIGMGKFVTIREIDRAAKFISHKIDKPLKIGIILGSGLGTLADEVQKPVVINYRDIPFWPRSTVQGHAGKLVIGELENLPVMIMQGRTHYYEGYEMDRITFPIRVMERLGVEVLVVTNAAGAIDPAYAPGDVMLITDHINLIGMAGLNPLRGPNLDAFGERFPDMSRAYDRGLLAITRKIAKQEKIKMREGVYICLAGPSFETPADLRFLRSIGANAVGMSTVPEVTVAHHGKMRVLGLSGISNKANLDGNTITAHEEVLAAGEIIVPKLVRLIRGVLRTISK
jgi:purine-nucleoside phosphorylase